MRLRFISLDRNFCLAISHIENSHRTVTNHSSQVFYRLKNGNVSKSTKFIRTRIQATICSPVIANVPCGGRLWATERIVDQELTGAYPRDVTRYISMHDCERRCVEERNFICKSAVFDVNLQECKLFAEDRSHRSARLSYARGMNYIENQCAVCEYQIFHLGQMSRGQK